ncbi:LexA family transcriptional regulator [Lactococcus garvieae]|uniref:LexA family transcriptional regulator n=1 Tax=Lactococcus garvieae TaxID=1363 RepID=UPI0038521A90
MNDIHLGEMINYYRKQNGWTMKELGEKMGKTESAISLWISNKRSPMVDDLDKLSKLFNVSPEVLMFGKVTPPIIEDTVETMKKLDEPRQQVVLDTATSQLKEQKAVKREKQMLPFKKMQLDKINNLVPYDHDQEGFAPVIGEIAAGTPIFSEQNFEGMRPVYGKYAGRDDVFWLHVKGDSMESEIHDGSFALILLSPDIDDGAIGAVRFTDDNSATLKCVHYEYDDAGYVKRIRLEPLNPKYPIQYADESNPAEIAGRLVKVEQDY